MKAKDERNRMASSMASASAAIRWVRLSSPVSGSCRDSFNNCSSRAWRSLSRRTMPCTRAGLPSAPAKPHGFLDGFGQRSNQMGAVELARQRIVPRQFQQLLFAGMALVVEADNALHARRFAVGAGETAWLPRWLRPAQQSDGCG